MFVAGMYALVTLYVLPPLGLAYLVRWLNQGRARPFPIARERLLIALLCSAYLLTVASLGEAVHRRYLHFWAEGSAGYGDTMTWEPPQAY